MPNIDFLSNLRKKVADDRDRAAEAEKKARQRSRQSGRLLDPLIIGSRRQNLQNQLDVIDDRINNSRQQDFNNRVGSLPTLSGLASQTPTTGGAAAENLQQRVDQLLPLFQGIEDFTLSRTGDISSLARNLSRGQLESLRERFSDLRRGLTQSAARQQGLVSGLATRSGASSAQRLAGLSAADADTRGQLAEIGLTEDEQRRQILNNLLQAESALAGQEIEAVSQNRGAVINLISNLATTLANLEQGTASSGVSGGSSVLNDVLSQVRGSQTQQKVLLDNAEQGTNTNQQSQQKEVQQTTQGRRARQGTGNTTRQPTPLEQILNQSLARPEDLIRKLPNQEDILIQENNFGQGTLLNNNL